VRQLQLRFRLKCREFTARRFILGDRLLMTQGNVTANHVPQPLLKRLLAERAGRDAVGINLLSSKVVKQIRGKSWRDGNR
jgi:hypothetical protein